MTGTNKPVALENIVAAIELGVLSTTGYLLSWNYPNTRVTRAANTRVTRGGNTRVTRGYFSATVYPEVHTIVLENVVSLVEVE